MFVHISAHGDAAIIARAIRKALGESRTPLGPPAATGGGKAAITGDFVLLATEVDAVMKALTSHGIAPTAVHSHMLGESPRLYFMHFWANADAVVLAQGLRAALDATTNKR